MNTSVAVVGLGVASLAAAIIALVFGHRDKRQTRTAITLTLSCDGKVVTFQGEPTATPKEILQAAFNHLAHEGHKSTVRVPAATVNGENERPPPSLEASNGGPAEDATPAAGRKLAEDPEHSADFGPQADDPESSGGAGHSAHSELSAHLEPSEEPESTWRMRPNSYGRMVRRRTLRTNQERSPALHDLRNSDIHDDRFARAILTGANFADSDLDGASFFMADLRNAILSESSLVDANLSGAQLDGAKMLRCNLLRANLEAARLIGADLTGSNLAGADLREANLEDATFDIDDLAGAQWNEKTVWPEEVRAQLYESSTRVAAARGDASAVFEVDSNPEEEEIGAGVRRRR